MLAIMKMMSCIDNAFALQLQAVLKENHLDVERILSEGSSTRPLWIQHDQRVPVNNAKQHSSCCLDLHVVFLIFSLTSPFALYNICIQDYRIHASKRTSKLTEHPRLNLSANSAATELELPAVQDRDPIAHYVVRLCCALHQSWVTRRLSSSWWKQILS